VLAAHHNQPVDIPQALETSDGQGTIDLEASGATDVTPPIR